MQNYYTQLSCHQCITNFYVYTRFDALKLSQVGFLKKQFLQLNEKTEKKKKKKKVEKTETL